MGIKIQPVIHVEVVLWSDRLGEKLPLFSQRHQQTRERHGDPRIKSA